MKFPLDPFKSEYSNNPQDLVINWFNENYQECENNSIYLAKYKNEDLPTIEFIRKNRINGYFQQFDTKIHKIAFGSGFYKDGKLSFVWIFSHENKEVPELMKDSSYFDSFDWTEIDKNDPEILNHLFPTDGEKYVFK